MPAVGNVLVNAAPWPRLPESHEPSSDVHVCVAASRLVAVTAVPALTFSSGGVNVKFWIVMSPPPPAVVVVVVCAVVVGDGAGDVPSLGCAVVVGDGARAAVVRGERAAVVVVAGAFAGAAATVVSRGAVVVDSSTSPVFRT